METDYILVGFKKGGDKKRLKIWVNAITLTDVFMM